MYKNIVALVLVVSLFSCKKADEKMEHQEPEKDSISNVISTDQKEVDSLIEISPEKLGQDLQAKKNDTLYITNFFATWCGPCMQEIPHFRKKMEELKGQPVKFTFVNLDNKTEWPTSVADFAAEYDLDDNIVLLDGNLLDTQFFKTNFKTWGGESIPFTVMKKGDKSDETIGSLTEEELTKKINSFLSAK